MRYRVAVALSLCFALSGCGGAAVVALGSVSSGLAIAKDVLDVDISIHSLLNDGKKPAQPIPPAQLVTHPEYVVVTPPDK